MQPRLKSSTKWTKLPSDITDQIRELFKQNFQKELKDCQVIVEGRLYKEEILLRVGYLRKGVLTQKNFEISMDYKLTTEDSAMKSLTVCVDAAGALMAEHFEAEEALELPVIWTEFPFEGKKVWLQFSTTNTDLEQQANALLGESSDSLVQGEVEEADDVGQDDEESLPDDEFSEDESDEMAETDEELDEPDNEEEDEGEDSSVSSSKKSKRQLH